MNVVSVVNAGKRRHGKEHWFWGVWTEVSPATDSWNQKEPAESGFRSSKAEAKNAALTFLRSVSMKCYRYSPNWSLDYLWNGKQGLPYYSRCKCGKDRWLWVVFELDVEKDLMGHGISESASQAMEDATSRFGSVHQTTNWAANLFRRKHAAEQRAGRGTNESGAANIELVYQCEPLDGDFSSGDAHSIVAYRVLKKTAKRVYVEAEKYRTSHWTGDWRDYAVPTFILDRREFEQTGKAEGRLRGLRHTFYAAPEIYYSERAEYDNALAPDCMIKLGLDASADADDIHRAYRRLATQTHPDKGGNPEEFKLIRRWYEEAMGLMR